MSIVKRFVLLTQTFGYAQDTGDNSIWKSIENTAYEDKGNCINLKSKITQGPVTINGQIGGQKI